MANIYYQQDCDLNKLNGKTVAIIGYGSQGHAHALNLKDSGVNVIVGLYTGSKSWAKAERAGLKVMTAADAAKAADIIMILINDEKQAKLYKESIEPNLTEGKTLAFAHGFNIHFGCIKPPKNVNVIMIAPKGPGHTVRSEYQAGKGVPCLIAVEQDATGDALDLGLAYALKLGKQFTGEEYRDLILTSVHDIDQYQTDSKYKGKLGAGYIDAHMLLMNVEGTPCIYLGKGVEETISLDKYFGDSSESLTYTNIEIENMSAVGISTTPSIQNGSITLKCTKAGTARLRITAIIGGSNVGGGDNMGGMEVTREAEIVVRRAVASNGAWL